MSRVAESHSSAQGVKSQISLRRTNGNGVVTQPLLGLGAGNRCDTVTLAAQKDSEYSAISTTEWVLLVSDGSEG